MPDTNDHIIRTLSELDVLYGAPLGASLLKEIDYLHQHYAAWIRASTFAVLATSGPGGLDASPRGDVAGFIEIADEKTLLLPDRRGNNRIDSLRNVIHDPRVALLFLIPGVGETLRVNGRAEISVAPDLLDRFAVGEARPRTVMVIRVETVFFQCSRAVVRARLWDAETHVPRANLPSAGAILSALSQAGFDGDRYDRELEPRIKATLY